MPLKEIAKDGTKVVASAGTAEQLVSTSVNTTCVWVEALPSNSGKVYIGGSTVSSTRGMSLDPEESFQYFATRKDNAERLLEFDLSSIYIDAANSSDGIKYFYIGVDEQ